ncbi:hypothetical protein [Synechococcus sp. PCC 6312]|uniref:hypothetical protein n=1 Tax=Synechococcus sp. (strain ATCC 27167 / PCC 6312) TaxID=195253 RepID=UPI00029F4514|nr:hypothetical protein [Synechococcus sp. PCC 6312]AFY60199.1 hypothetical protein Syn6312_0999 [Synechococcus sp. PCC 6312]
MKKADAWVILRFDGDAVRLKDYVAVKGIYDSEDAAQSAIPNLSEGSDYIVIRSRRFLEDNKSMFLTKEYSEIVQGLKIQSSYRCNDKSLHDQLQTVRDLWNQLPPSNRRRAILPLLSQLTELAVAKVTGASIVDDPRLGADLKLTSGELVEVKTILLDPERRKSPNLQFRGEIEFDLLAVVIFDPNLKIEIARIIPVDALKLHARRLIHLGGGSITNLRVTQSFLDYPGFKDINLANYSFNVG